MNPVVQWFGDKFSSLDPLLQNLHRYGGEISGLVAVEYGKGIGGFVGRRVGKILGLPNEPGVHEFSVSITHTDSALLWSRRFNANQKMVSVFVPHGRYPSGFWSESTGNIALTLGVFVNEGGWYWVQRKVRFKGLSLPLFLVPSTTAYKRINSGKYEFSVSLKLPLIGKLFSYSGLLTPKAKIV